MNTRVCFSKVIIYPPSISKVKLINVPHDVCNYLPLFHPWNPWYPWTLELAFKYIMLILDVSRAKFKTNWPVAET